MNAAAAGNELPAAALHAQLFRYAQDMDALMQQHDRLLNHHQMVLQSIGREIPTHDLLATLLLQACPLHLVTDGHGRITRMGPALAQRLPAWELPELPKTVLDWVEPATAARLQQMLQRFFGTPQQRAGVQCALQWATPTTSPVRLECLVLQGATAGGRGLYWFFLESATEPESPLAVQQRMLQPLHCAHGLLITNTYGTIRYTNQGCQHISGYSEAELVGQNPRMLGSGRHDARFFEDFWQELLDHGCWSGTLFNRRKNGQIYLEWQSITLVENLDAQALYYIAATTDLTREEPDTSHLKHLAFQDPLTGLPNRRMLAETFANAITVAQREGADLSVLFLDLDRFKPVNDELGHDVGDLVLKQVGERLQSALQPGDFLARVGGDEFVILLCGSERAARAEGLGRYLHQVLHGPMQVGAHRVVVGASVGCARYPQDGADMVSLLTHADDAMYSAKRFGLQFCFYDSGSQRHTEPNLEFEIWSAIEKNQLQLHYQPQRSTDGSGRVRGCEVLVRWVHPVRGDIAAPTFIPMAERNGAIVSIGKWVLAQACAQLRAWQLQGMAAMTLSINISLRQLRDPHFTEFVRQQLQQNGLAPHLLALEFAEADTLIFREEDERHLRALHAIGVRLAIDDFGASFSSLARLHSLCISGLKINSQFVQELESNGDARSISKSLLAIGQALGIEVIAQGVENEFQARLLQEQGCAVMQGFYAGVPLPAERFMAQVQSH